MQSFTCSCPLTQDCINILPASQYFVKGGPSSPRANKSRYLQPSNSLADALQSMAVHHQWNSYSAPKNALSRSGHRKEFLDLIKREVTNPIGKGEGGHLPNVSQSTLVGSVSAGQGGRGSSVAARSLTVVPMVGSSVADEAMARNGEGGWLRRWRTIIPAKGIASDAAFAQLSKAEHDESACGCIQEACMILPCKT